MKLRLWLGDLTPGVIRFHLSSFTDPKVVYVVQRVRLPGRRYWTCSCPRFEMKLRLTHEFCKHIDFLRDVEVQLGGTAKLVDAIRIMNADLEAAQTLRRTLDLGAHR